jgi:hypothetical protein
MSHLFFAAKKASLFLRRTRVLALPAPAFGLQFFEELLRSQLVCCFGKKNHVPAGPGTYWSIAKKCLGFCCHRGPLGRLDWKKR